MMEKKLLNISSKPFICHAYSDISFNYVSTTLLKLWKEKQFKIVILLLAMNSFQLVDFVERTILFRECWYLIFFAALNPAAHFAQLLFYPETHEINLYNFSTSSTCIYMCTTLLYLIFIYLRVFIFLKFKVNGQLWWWWW